jgi:hypothetical protein
MRDMTFEMFGAGCFGLVIGYVAFHVFSVGGTAFDVKQLGAFIAALLGAVVLSAFPAGTTLFAAYASGLALGFFLVPGSRVIVSVSSSVLSPPPARDVPSEVADPLKYVEDNWPEVERVVQHALARHKGIARASDLRALPIDEAGRVSALRRYARTYPERTSFGQGCFGWTLRVVEPSPDRSHPTGDA